MKNEPFYKTMEKQLFSDLSWFPPEETEHLEELIYCFYVHGDFMDDIPPNDRYAVISKILIWVEGLWLNDFKREMKETRNPKRPVEKIDSYLKTIRQMKKILEDEYMTGDMINIRPMCISGIRHSAKNSRKEFYNHLKELEKDLEEREFRHFDEDSFFQEKLTTKKHLDDILSSIIEKYSLKKAKRKKKDLIDCIPLPSF
ncbi:hypothetical protein [Nitratifractor salsuginis]|uniref:Uncharacterized protein n=1 Tax=Nitratifractor salsuginis (strain DSM 16511 / JCM 12458 / E9I37-1) TaxID=749222 RepID=E6WZ46_NITSE|nr:hypothetical protein [Nitratifractor salsuginis]ADV45496.1 hypothetical protein Nitsa_0224 [Nitratifractor salsuginis DSM 16511]